jgi:hypothetical protein
MKVLFTFAVGMKWKANPQISSFGACTLTRAKVTRRERGDLPGHVCHRFGYRMVESVPLQRLAQIMGYDSLDTTKLSIQGTRHDVQQATETIPWT